VRTANALQFCGPPLWQSAATAAAAYLCGSMLQYILYFIIVVYPTTDKQSACDVNEVIPFTIQMSVIVRCT
jgi:hypothetical protein